MHDLLPVEYRFLYFVRKKFISESMVTVIVWCVYVREGNPRDLASGLSPVHTLNYAIISLLHQHGFAFCAL